jgi:hypothetical protein
VGISRLRLSGSSHRSPHNPDDVEYQLNTLMDLRFEKKYPSLRFLFGFANVSLTPAFRATIADTSRMGLLAYDVRVLSVPSRACGHRRFPGP